MSPAAIFGRCSFFCASVPYFSSAGPSIEMPKETSGGRAPIAAISWRTILACSPSSPPPPYSFGQCGTVQPLSRIRSNQMRCGSDEKVVLRPPQKVSSSEVIGRRICGGQLASSQVRVSRRKSSRSDICVSVIVLPTLAPGQRNSIYLWRRPSPAGCGLALQSRVCAKLAAIEKQEETEMRLKLLSPGEMSADQKQTYDESIAGKRGAPPAPMMAWLNSPEMARHATRLGGVLRFDTIFPAKLSEIAILVTARHWTSHYEWYAHKRLGLKGGMDPKIIEDIRDRRTPNFDDPKGQMIYDVARSLHEARGLSKALYEEAVKVLTLRGLVEIIGLCGYYTMVSMTLNTFEFDLPEGEVSELA